MHLIHFTTQRSSSKPELCFFGLCTGCVPVTYFNYERNKAAFLSKFLLRRSEVNNAISEIWWECNNVATMKLFKVTSVGPLQLDDFEVMQSQVHIQVCQCQILTVKLNVALIYFT